MIYKIIVNTLDLKNMTDIITILHTDLGKIMIRNWFHNSEICKYSQSVVKFLNLQQNISETENFFFHWLIYQH